MATEPVTTDPAAPATAASTDGDVSFPLAVPRPPGVESVSPVRLADTRPGEKTVDGLYAGMPRPAADSITEIKIAGRGGVPGDATAALMNLTTVLPSANTFMTVFPCGTTRPNVSNVNSPLRDIRANSVFAKLSASGTVCVYTVAATDFIIDINGYVPAAGSPTSVDPVRLFDSRPGEKTIDGLYAGPGRVAAGSITEVKIAGRGGVAGDASAAIINLTSVLPAVGNFLTAFPCGTERPNVSNLNSPINDVRANSAFVQLSPWGTVCIYSVYATDFVIDVNGYVPRFGSPYSVNPVRLFDSRPGEKTIDGLFAGSGRAAPNSITEIKIVGRGGVAPEATAVVINLTSVLPSAGTFLTAFPCGGAVPNVSNLNSPPTDIRANSVFVKLSAAGTVCVYTVAATDFIVDINGYSTTQPVVGTCNINGAATPSGIPEAECQSLLSLYKATGGPTWTERANWATATNPCNWYGITCSGGHVAKIDLSRNNLTGAIPPEIGDLPGLALLWLSNNQIGSVPAQIGNLTNLVGLDLDANALSALPPEMAKLTGLHGLALSNNRFATFPALVGGLTNLTSFRYDGGKLTTYPTQLNSLTKLTYLSLANNSLTSIPAEIALLNNLDRLDLDLNRLTKLPPQATKLTKLTELQLSSNQFTAYPAEINSLVNLTSLSLYGNKLTTLPAGIASLSRLAKLGLDGNPLRTYPAAINTLGGLTTLRLSNTQIASVPVEINKLTQLAELDLSTNLLTAYPTQINALTNLTTLHLTGNKIPNLPPEIGGLTKLTGLYLGSNALTAYPTQINPLVNLSYLDLSANRIPSLPPDIGGLTRLLVLKLNNNLLTAYPTQINSLSALKTLNLSYNAIPTLPADIASLPNLNELNLQKNRVAALPAEIASLTQLWTFNVAENNLTSLPIQLGALTSLTSLNLSKNQISGDITDAFTPLMSANQIKTLTLNGNKCMSTTNPALASWLTARDANWKTAGCP